MANERLRDALMHAGHSTATAADEVGVDAKTVERWLTQDRVPYPRHRGALAALVDRSESYLWPDALPAQRQKKAATSEIVEAFPHRSDVPLRLWDDLLQRSSARIDVLVHAGQFLHERAGFISTVKAKAEAGVDVRIAFGAPESAATELRSTEERLGPGVLGARIRYGLASYRPLRHTAGVEFRFHETTLYNSIFRFDDEMIVNMHVFGVPGPHAPAMHLRKLAAGDVFDTYERSFVAVWEQSKPAEW
ncbi:XRE family transcriptional regulator [Actinomycetospora flava]|uniref:XRE family transcriptional regulator n=1 Tax=Actinomycetospora flava TaxID=3129232 RepID=A0ABU8M6D3_9PSEU